MLVCCFIALLLYPEVAGEGDDAGWDGDSGTDFGGAVARAGGAGWGSVLLR